jgi:hypothetical protein
VKEKEENNASVCVCVLVKETFVSVCVCVNYNSKYDSIREWICVRETERGRESVFVVLEM